MTQPQDPQFQHAPATGADTTPRPPSGLVKLTKWLLIAVIAVIVVRVLGALVSAATGAIAGAMVASGSAMDPDTLIAVVAAVGVAQTVVVGLVSLAALVLAIVVSVQAAGRGRVGGIIVAAAVMLGPLVSWLLGMITSALIGGDPMADGAMGLRGAMLGADVLVTLLVFAAMIIGTVMARRWVRRHA